MISNRSLNVHRFIIRCAVCMCLLSQMGCASLRAPWTIRCLELSGPNRSLLMSQFVETLKRTPGIRSKDVFVVDSSEGFTRLYYGTYYRKTNPRTGRRSMSTRLRADLDLIKQLGDESKRRYFLQAIPVRMPTPDVGKPEWDLRRAHATYSLQVAFFEPNDDFWQHKKAAAEYCRLLRERGYEAYYYQTDASSIVTVGAFGPEAVETRADGRTYYSNRVLALQRDKLLQHNLLNGRVYRVTNDQGEHIAMPSRLVHTPQARGRQP